MVDDGITIKQYDHIHEWEETVKIVAERGAGSSLHEQHVLFPDGNVYHRSREGNGYGWGPWSQWKYLADAETYEIETRAERFS